MKKLFYILIVLSLIFPFSVSAATYTSQPSAKDAFFWETQPTVNFGSNVNLWIYCVASGNARGILNFDVSDLPAGATISSAKLNLNYYSRAYADPVGLSVDVFKVTRDNWTEAGSTWNKYDGSNDWTAAGGDYVTSNPAGANVNMPADYGWIEWEIKDIVEDAIANVSSSVNVIVKFTTEGTGGKDAFLASNNYTHDTDLRPKLVIEYTAEEGAGRQLRGQGIKR